MALSFSLFTTQMMTLESTTKARDLMQDVARELCLSSLEQFALYLEVKEGELRYIEPEEFVFDTLRLTLLDVQHQASLKRHQICESLKP